MIGRSVRATFAVLAAGGMLTTGLSACSANTVALACTAIAGNPTPAQNATETITIKTLAGAKVATKAAFKAVTKIRPDVTADSTGIAKVNYAVAMAVPGYPVKVTVNVKKAGRTGTCTTTFVPKRAVTLPKPPLKAAISVSWNLPAQMPFGYSGACSTNPHPRTGGNCGTVFVSALISGFSTYGGVPTCPSGNPSDCVNSNLAALTGSVALSWALTCPATQNTSSHSDVMVGLGNEWMSYKNTVSGLTRIDADSARLEIAADMPFIADVAGCTVSPTLESVSVSNVALHLAGSTYPTSNFSAAGPFTP